MARVLGRRRAPPDRPVSPAALQDEPGTSDATFDGLLEEAEAHLRAGRNARAEAVLSEALAIRHDSAQAHYKLGLACMRQGRLEEASDSFVMAVHFDERMAPAHGALARALREQGRYREALTGLERAIAAGTATAELHNLRGVLLLDLGNAAAAAASFEDALALDPHYAGAHSNLGYVLFRDCGAYERGAQHIERALQLDPGNVDYLCNHSMVLLHHGEHERALATCDRLLAVQPAMQEARLNRALILLALGRFEQAWDDYEARKSVRCNFAARSFPCAEWQGEDLRGKTLLVYGEQGLGDEIMFASCFGEVIARADHCVIECAPALERLFRRSFPDATVFAGSQHAETPSWWGTGPEIDLHAAAGSLPRHFRRAATDFPAHDGYLLPDPGRVAYWRQRLAKLGPGIKVGISWRGGTPSTRGNLRSIELAAWAPILQLGGARFVSLQYGDTAMERAQLTASSGGVPEFWDEAIENIDETAALVASLDLVISVCTAVVHLAGAIGRPAWVLVPKVPEWRYQAFASTMPWYPSVHLIRQQAAGDWEPVIGEAARRLRETVASRVHAH